MNRFFTLFLFSVFLLAGLADASAQGDLIVSPRRVVLGGTHRTAELNLANTGRDTVRYLISTVEVRMSDDGGFHLVDPSEDTSLRTATPHIRYFPRAVTLGPGEAQTVKVQISSGAGLEEGEYRSHLYFRAVPPPTPLGEAGSAGGASADSSVAVVLKPVFGISIPVILRVGEATASIAISDLRFTPGEAPKLDLTFRRSGTASVYGDLRVEHIAPGGAVTAVGLARGVAVYTPNDRRSFSLLLDNAARVNWRSGKLRVSYVDGSSKGALLSEGDIQLN